MRVRICSALAAIVWLAAAPAAAHDVAAPPRAGADLALAGGCYSLRAPSTGAVVVRDGASYAATVERDAEPARFRMQATDLGSYLLLDTAGDVLAVWRGDGIGPVREPSAAADWRVQADGDGFALRSRADGKALAASAVGQLRAGGEPTRFAFERADGCATFPEAELNLVGGPSRGASPLSDVRGLLDMHSHMMAFEAFGGGLHCGRPWHPYGITKALVDCPDHQVASGAGALIENFAAHGTVLRTHDPVGWPTFKDWPSHDTLTHELVYYRWLERTYRAGLRLLSLLAVDNSALCQLNLQRRHPCNDMQTVRREIRDTYALQDYIDAQHGGPGKGWFRIVKDPFEARRVINAGKLAVVLGIEVSEPFDCGLRNEVPQCDRAQIDRGLDEVHGLGVRQMELVNKFDNALAGVTFDDGVQGPIVNLGNRAQTGRFWAMETCTGPDRDRQPLAIPGGDVLSSGLGVLLPKGTLPLYPKPPTCNTRGLSSLGEHAIRGLARRGMLFDPDHMSVLARSQALAVVEAERYPGVLSSHSWADRTSYRRIYKLGGVITPYAGGSESFVREWRDRRADHAASGSRFSFTVGFGDDANGFAAQGAPRGGADPVRYPFRSFDGRVSLDRQRSGRRVFDINRDGVAHFGLYADWIEDLRLIAGDEIVADMARGPEAYLQMWERAAGVPGPRCVPARGTVGRRGLRSVRLGLSPTRLLRAAGQPARRPGRTYRYCVTRRRGAVTASLDGRERVQLVATTARSHRAAGIAPGRRTRALRRVARNLGGGAWLGRRRGSARLVYLARDGRVRVVGVATHDLSRRPAALRRALRASR